MTPSTSHIQDKVLHYRYRVLLTNGDMVEMTERVLEAQGTLAVSKYRHHWQDRNGLLIKRWDNAPHYRAIATCPITSMTGQKTVSGIIQRPRVLRCSSTSSRKQRRESRIGSRYPLLNKQRERPER